jgi:hypothetical protein
MGGELSNDKMGTIPRSQKRARDILQGSTLYVQISYLFVAPLGIEPKFQV